LNGLEKYLGKEFLTTRYADDFIIAGKNLKELRNIASSKINSFLLEKGLKLHLDKTRIFSIEEGFDFLDLNFREYTNIGQKKLYHKKLFLLFIIMSGKAIMVYDS
jgi:RNA-directed DNA polymerase